MPRSPACARWIRHINGIGPPREMRCWLTDSASLTSKLKACGKEFRVRQIRQSPGLCLADECVRIGLSRRNHVFEREVVLECDRQPVVFAHTVVPFSATASDWPFFRSLGERPLGTALFGDPRVVRGPFEYARLRQPHPLLRRAAVALGKDEIEDVLHARRCLYRRNNGVLLVTELFLPSIVRIGAHTKRAPVDTQQVRIEDLTSKAFNELIF